MSIAEFLMVLKWSCFQGWTFENVSYVSLVHQVHRKASNRGKKNGGKLAEKDINLLHKRDALYIDGCCGV